MRVRTVACACLLVAASVGGAKTLAAASPDCARWIKEYQQGLARRAVLGKKHVVKAVHHITIPKVHLQHVSTAPGRVRPPKLSPAEMLKRFKVLCGEDLPDEVMPAAFVPTGLEDAMIPESENTGSNDEIAQLTGNGTPPAFTDTPTNTTTTTNGNQPPNNGGTNTGGTTNNPIIPNNPTTGTNPSPVPEPGSFVLLLTGLGTMPAVLRMRRKFKKA